MKCHYCGNEVTADQKFCMRCGTRLEQEPIPEPAAEPVQQTERLDNLPVWKADPMEQETAPAPVAVARPVYREEPSPALKLPTKRGLGKMFFLGLITFGIYPVVIWSRIVTELNIAASRHDGQRTMPYFAACSLAPITLGIYVWIWMHNFCSRVGSELERRNLAHSFGASTFWLWGVLGSLIVVGPFIFVHKLMKAMNLINADYNEKG